MSFVVVSGLSGAGRTTALKALEDQGYKTIDNLPITMLPALIDNIINTNSFDYAVGIDARSMDPKPRAIAIINDLQSNKCIDLKVIFLDCAPERIQQRYNESRRPHPIVSDNLMQSISLERALLLPLQKIAEVQLDTTDLNIRHLRLILQHYLCDKKEVKLKIQLFSFSYKKGIPEFADLVLDMRFLSNPFYDLELKQLTGVNEKVQSYIKEDSRWLIVDYHLKEFLVNAICGYQEQGRFYINLAFGCTGGQHRSVFTCEYFYNTLKNLNYDCTIEHRDLNVELK